MRRPQPFVRTRDGTSRLAPSGSALIAPPSEDCDSPKLFGAAFEASAPRAIGRQSVEFAPVAHLILQEFQQRRVYGKHRVRVSAKLNSLKTRLLAAEMLTCNDLCTRLGASRTTISKWRVQGRLKARICNDRGQWLYWPPETQPTLRRPRSKNPSTDESVNSPARGVT